MTHPQRHTSWLASLLLAAFSLAGCGGGGGGDAPAADGSGSVVIFEQSTAPQKLSGWGVLRNVSGKLTLNSALVPYDLNTPLFSDYAFKQRAAYVPPGKQIVYKTDGSLEFPIGSALVKTFYYPRATGTDATHTPVARQSQTSQGDSIDLATHRVIETRLLVLQPDGTWTGLAYVWDADHSDATLKVGGQDVKLELVPTSGASEKIVYNVPSAATCQQCHSTQTAGGRGILPIGTVARNLNKNYQYSPTVTANQLVRLNDLKLLSGFTGLPGAPVNADWRDTSKSLDERAKAYLDVNCAHCHSARGAAFQSGLLLNFSTIGTLSPSTVPWGVCKQPLAYGGPGTPYRYDIVPGRADQSILLYRMSHTATRDVMPAVGRVVNHTEANDLIRDWINQLTLPACQ